jgi:meso-butanediol dehydrogenase/(S,S)-butanediol dehydrogenase/diacetyl reductase
MTDDDWHFTIRNELDLIFFVTQAAWPHLIATGGVIVNTASV